MTEVKICGLTRAVDARLAVEAGAAWLGVIFAGGPRLLTGDRAREVLAPAPAHVRRVGVFGSQSVEEIATVVRQVPLDVVQLHASRPLAEVAELRATVAAELWAVVRVADGRLPAEFGDLAAMTDAVVVDSLVPGALGGTGFATDWPRLAAALESIGRPARLVLAGGLQATNVASAIALVRPQVVDVSSGVEAAVGEKDPARLRAFIEAAHLSPQNA